MRQPDTIPALKLRRLLYRSEPTLSGTAEEFERQVDAIVRAAREANARVGITGALLTAPGLFIQALEGPASAVEKTFERICCDLRHRHLHLLEYVAVESRVFADWSMTGIAAGAQVTGLLANGTPMDMRDAAPRSASAVVAAMRARLHGGPGMRAELYQALPTHATMQ